MSDGFNDDTGGDDGDDFDGSDFSDLRDDPIAVADQLDYWFGWLLDQGYSPLAIQSGLTMASADFAGFLYETFEEDDDDE